MHSRTGLTLPVHFWLSAAQWSAIIMLAMAGIYVIEKYVLGLKGTPMRMVVDPSEVAIRFFGLAHFTVATYFLFSSKNLHNLRGFLMLALFSLLAIGVCSLFSYFGGHTNILAVIAVFLFFLIHAMRDEVFFYRMRSGKAITDEEYPHVYRMLLWVQVAGVGLLGALLYPALIYKHAGDIRHVQFNIWINTIFPAGWPLSLKMTASSVPFLLMIVVACWRIQSKHAGGLVRLLRSHTPLSIIVASIVALALSSILVGTWILNFIVLMHFTGWFIYAVVGIKKQPSDTQRAITWRTPNEWIRRNLVGFWVFHGGLAAMFFGLIALNHWVLAQTPMAFSGRSMPNPLSILFSKESFYYWTIAHVTLAFLPKPAPLRC